MSICKSCGSKYSKWTTPVSAKGVCRACFDTELKGIPRVVAPATPSVADESLSHMEQTFVPENDTDHLKIAASAKPKVPIHWSSFLPRSRSKLVFAVTMAAYAVALSNLVSVLLGAIHAERPPREFYQVF